MRWGGVAVVCLVVGGAGPAAGVVLTGIDVRSTPSGAAARLVFSAPARIAVHRADAVGDGFARVYLDLPPGTRIVDAVARRLPTPPPVAALRVGMAESGVLRVVLDLESDATFAVERSGRAVTVVLASAAAPAPSDTPAPARRDAAPPPVAVPGLRPKIVLDPGHGGSDPGAEGFAIEKDVTLDIARRLARLLAERLGAEVVLTRTRDATLPLAARTARANGEGADLFVSIHANASRSRRLHGIETYVLNNTHDRATIRLARMENGLDLIAPRRDRADLRYILSDLVQVGKMDESVALATAVQRGLVGRLTARYPDVADLGVKRGPFYVLVGAYMPCVLVETSFLSHPAEGRRLASADYRESVAEGIETGIARFLADARRARTL